MAIEGFQPVFVPDNHQVAIAPVVLRQPDLSVKGGIDRIARMQGQVNPLVTAAAPGTEGRIDLALPGAAITAQGIYDPERYLRRKIVQRSMVGIGFIVVPAFGKHLLGNKIGRILPIVPGIVGEQQDLDMLIRRSNRVHDGFFARIGRMQGFHARTGNQHFGTLPGHPGQIHLRIGTHCQQEGQQGQEFPHRQLIWHQTSLPAKRGFPPPSLPAVPPK